MKPGGSEGPFIQWKHATRLPTSISERNVYMTLDGFRQVVSSTLGGRSFWKCAAQKTVNPQQWNHSNTKKYLLASSAPDLPHLQTHPGPHQPQPHRHRPPPWSHPSPWCSLSSVVKKGKG